MRQLLTRSFPRAHSSFVINACEFSFSYIPNNKRIKILSHDFTTCGEGKETEQEIKKTNNLKPRSPYVILQLKSSATKDDIKSSFRKLAKKFHPDLNPLLSPDLAHGKMSELIQAYDQLMDDDGGFSSRVGDARVALACEMFTLDELRIDRLHNVYSFRVIYDEDSRASDIIEEELIDSKNGSETSRISDELNPFPIMELKAHPDDSISDLKRQIQSSFKEEWGLSGRRLDRDRIATGWELVKVMLPWKHKNEVTADYNCKVDRDDGDGNGDGQGEGKDNYLQVMSYHLFLHSYDIQHGNLIHAIVRKY